MFSFFQHDSSFSSSVFPWYITGKYSDICSEAKGWCLEQIFLYRQEIVFILLNENTHSLRGNLYKYLLARFLNYVTSYSLSHLTESYLCRIKVRYFSLLWKISVIKLEYFKKILRTEWTLRCFIAIIRFNSLDQYYACWIFIYLVTLRDSAQCIYT